MIVWLNGAFGVGKTAAARELLALLPGSTLFETELIGAGLRRMLPREHLGSDGGFHDLPAWRRLVADAAAALLTEVPGPLVAPTTLLRQEHRDEIFGALAARRIPVCHVLLHAEETILRERIARDATVEGESVRDWRLSRLPDYHAALPRITGHAHPLDTSGLTPGEIARRIAEVVRDGVALDIVQTPEPTAETLAAGVLLFDEHDRVLLVDPTYKPGWEFPGGVVERGEPPARAGMREVAEELGIELTVVPKLLVLDWEPPIPPGYGGLRLLFDGGRLEAARAADLLLPGAELRGWHFVTEAEAAGMLPPVRFRRLQWALRARERGTTLNLEAGAPVGI